MLSSHAVSNEAPSSANGLNFRKKKQSNASPDGVLDVHDGPHRADHPPLLVAEVHDEGEVLAARLVAVVGVRDGLGEDDAPGNTGIRCASGRDV